MITAHLTLPQHQIADICRRYRIRKLALFGSVLREDFRPESDVDVLYEPQPDAILTLPDLVTMRDELETLLGRRVDLVSQWSIEHSNNPARRNAILSLAQVVYDA